jgi:hypothetical protein
VANWNILLPFGIFLWPVGNLGVSWYIFPRFGILYHEKSGNVDWNPIDTCLVKKIQFRNLRAKLSKFRISFFISFDFVIVTHEEF